MCFASGKSLQHRKCEEKVGQKRAAHLGGAAIRRAGIEHPSRSQDAEIQKAAIDKSLQEIISRLSADPLLSDQSVQTVGERKCSTARSVPPCP